jgi:hypothetical protein
MIIRDYSTGARVTHHVEKGPPAGSEGDEAGLRYAERVKAAPVLYGREGQRREPGGMNHHVEMICTDMYRKTSRTAAHTHT